MTEEKATNIHDSDIGPPEPEPPEPDDELVFADETPDESTERAPAWTVMIVDDEPEIHRVTELALDAFAFDGRGLEFLHAFSGKEGREVIERHPDVALILLDVVMEEDDAGLELARYLREDCGNHLVRIVLRTGQPGAAPEARVVLDYDINDYKTKTELTSEKLFSCVITSLRGYSLLKARQALTAACVCFVPQDLLRLLDRPSLAEVALGDHVIREMTVMFSTIRDFGELSAEMSPSESFELLNSFFHRLSPIVRYHQGFVVKYLASGMMAIFPDHPDAALRCALEQIRAIRIPGLKSVELGIGLHQGKMMLGVVGEAGRMQLDAFSDDVNLTARLVGLSRFFGASVVVSSQAMAAFGELSRATSRALGKVRVKGRQKAVSVFEAFAGDPVPRMVLRKVTRDSFEEGLRFYQEGQFARAAERFSQVLNRDPDDQAAKHYIRRSAELMARAPVADWDGIETMTEKHG